MVWLQSARRPSAPSPRETAVPRWCGHTSSAASFPLVWSSPFRVRVAEHEGALGALSSWLQTRRRQLLAERDHVLAVFDVKQSDSTAQAAASHEGDLDIMHSRP